MIRHLKGKTWHKRYMPVEHEFRYPLAYIQVELDHTMDKSLDSFETGSPLLKFNSQDYLPQYEGGLYQRIQNCIQYHEATLEYNQVKLVTMPKVLGFCFNPVNFYLLLNNGNETGLIVEINNTFGEKHTYVYPRNPLDTKISIEKTFHVSPFNNVAGFYELKLKNTPEFLHIGIDLHRDNQLIFKSYLNLHPVEKPLGILQVIRNLPNLLLTTIRIGKQAAVLYYQKKLEVYDHPEPRSRFTLKWKKPVFLQRILTGKL